MTLERKFWTDQETADLLWLVDRDGLSFAFAARRLQGMYPDTLGNVTRNACIGRYQRVKGNRNGQPSVHGRKLKTRKPAAKPQQAPRHTEEQRQRMADEAAEAAARRVRMQARARDEAITSAEAQPVVADPVRSPAMDALLDKKAGQCCWPEGDPKEQGFRFCCAPVTTPITSLPYCNAHQLRACSEPRRDAIRKQQQVAAGHIERRTA